MRFMRSALLYSLSLSPALKRAIKHSGTGRTIVDIAHGKVGKQICEKRRMLASEIPKQLYAISAHDPAGFRDGHGRPHGKSQADVGGKEVKVPQQIRYVK